MSSKLKPWLLLAVIFVVGVVTGSALTIGLGPHIWHFVHPQEQHDMKKHWMEHLTHGLNLTLDQQAKIQPILADAEAKIQSVHHDEMERGAQIFQSVHAQISALLTPDQQVLWQKMESDREKMFSGHMRPWGTPPPGGPGDMHHPGGPDDGVVPPPPPPPPVAPTNLPPLPPAPSPNP
jgi:hypothetical protein